MERVVRVPLSERQAEIATTVVSGRSSREIAAALSLSPGGPNPHRGDLQQTRSSLAGRADRSALELGHGR
jgi:FixJ family two-component response regulator